MAKRATQSRLPGTVNNIEELDELALAYAAVRDERMALGRQETELKDKVHACMTAHKLKNYKYGEVEINIVPAEEDVKVKVSKPKEQSPADTVTISTGMTDKEFESVLDANDINDPEDLLRNEPEDPNDQIGNQ
jgi:hypothetical protein